MRVMPASLPTEWVNLTTASRLVGLDVALLSKRAAQGKYGPTRRITGQPTPELQIMLRGLELAARRTWSTAQLAAAKAGTPLPPDGYRGPDLFPRRQRTLEQRGAALVATPVIDPQE